MFDYFRMPIKFAVKNVRLQVYNYDHSGSANAKYQRWMLSATKQAVSIKPATTVGHFYETLTLQTLYCLIILFFLLKKNLCSQTFPLSTNSYGRFIYLCMWRPIFIHFVLWVLSCKPDNKLKCLITSDAAFVSFKNRNVSSASLHFMLMCTSFNFGSSVPLILLFRILSARMSTANSDKGQGRKRTVLRDTTICIEWLR